MASAPRAASNPSTRPAPDSDAEGAKASGTASVTYNPIHEQDPHMVVWHGQRFHAGKPVLLERGASKLAELFASVEGNPYFEVDGQNDAKPIRRSPSKIKTPEEYRAYAHEWIKLADDPDAMEERWADEAEIRNRVGWGSDDDSLMAPIYQPKLEEMRKAKQHMA